MLDFVFSFILARGEWSFPLVSQTFVFESTILTRQNSFVSLRTETRQRSCVQWGQFTRQQRAGHGSFFLNVLPLLLPHVNATQESQKEKDTEKCSEKLKNFVIKLVEEQQSS